MKQRAEAVVGLFGVRGDSARGKIGRGTWETRGDKTVVRNK
jgi:hypothetical protein